MVSTSDIFKYLKFSFSLNFPMLSLLVGTSIHSLFFFIFQTIFLNLKVQKILYVPSFQEKTLVCAYTIYQHDQTFLFLQSPMDHLSYPVVLLWLFTLASFSHQCELVSFYWSLSDCHSPQVSRTLLSILADLNNALFGIVSACPPFSNSSSPLTKPLRIVLSANPKQTIKFTYTYKTWIYKAWIVAHLKGNY